MILSIDVYRYQLVISLIIGLIVFFTTKDIYLTLMVLIASVVIMRYIDIDGKIKNYL